VAAVPVDLDKIWAHLESTYGGEAGQIALYKQLAPMLINRLHLNDKDMRRTASAVIAYQNVRTSPASFGSKTGPYTLYERRDVNEVFDALSHVFEWSGLDVLVAGTQASPPSDRRVRLQVQLARQVLVPGFRHRRFQGLMGLEI